MENAGASEDILSLFNYSVENHFTAVDIIFKLCGESENITFEEGEFERLLNSVTFLRDWRQINRSKRVVYFDSVAQVNGSYDGIGLPQFSAAEVPKTNDIPDESTSQFRKDFVLNVGGTVWALDWCPRLDVKSDSDFTSEFIAISAHPPGSPYHKLGTPVSGRGIVQIWCILNRKGSEEDSSNPLKKPNKKIQRHHATKKDETQLKKPRGRPRKTTKTMSLYNPESESEFVTALAVEYPDESLNSRQISENIIDIPSTDERKGKKWKACEGISTGTTKPTCRVQRINHPKNRTGVKEDRDPLYLTDNQEIGPIADLVEDSLRKDGVRNVACDDSAFSLVGNPIPDGIFLPRVALCLAHDGEVAWDVKWRPHNASDSDCMYRMGYLAVILGDGSIEVWDVPTPRTMNIIYSSRQEEDGDPRYVKMEPVFRCSSLHHGDRQSIPLILEWSTSQPHDLLLTGCHDGVVALFKFSTNGPREDSRPVLCFSADTVPIRALAWAPSEGDTESRNVIVTAGHDGMKFWDLRDPYRPLWFPKLHDSYIYSLDWPPDPRCLITTYDDGTLRLFSQIKAANDAPVTGKPFSGAKSQGEHFYCCSSFALWSVHVSRLTGRVAYCGADGKVTHFQIRAKEVDSNDTRNRAPHFLCGALTEYGSGVIVNSPQAVLSDAVVRSGNVARTCVPLLYGSIQAEREPTKAIEPKDQVLAITSEADPGDDDMNVPLKSLKKLKAKKTKSRKGRDEDQVLIDGEDEGANASASANGKADEGVGNHANGKTDEGAGNTDSDMKADGRTDEGAGNSNMKADEAPEPMFPPKVVAMHRVRWNMNKGSERWLCYGGAAGIVRCQEIIFQAIKRGRKGF